MAASGIEVTDADVISQGQTMTVETIDTLSSREGGSTGSPNALSNPFDLAWIEAWGSTFLGEGGWRGPVSIYRLNDTPGPDCQVVAFARQRVGPFTVAALAGYYWPARGVGVFGSLDVHSAAGALARAVVRDPPSRFMRLGPVADSDGATTAFIRALRRLHARGLRRVVGSNYLLALPPDRAHLFEEASPSLLKNLAYLRRRLEKQFGCVKAERHILDARMPGNLIDRLQAIEDASWVADDGGHPKFKGDRNRRFWTELSAHKSNRHSRVAIWILSVGGTDVAFSAHLETDEWVWIVANSYDATWKVHSPGSLLAFEVLNFASSNGQRYIDWGQGDSGYKSRWGAKPIVNLNEYILFAPGMLGFLFYHCARVFLRDWEVV